MRQRVRSKRQDSRSGFLLITLGISAVALFSALGLVVDLGRMFVLKGQLQSYVDAAALAAVLELDGTSTGISDSDAASRQAREYNALGEFLPSLTAVQFGTAATGPWLNSGAAPINSTHARVSGEIGIDLYFIPILTRNPNGIVRASAVAAQVSVDGMSSGLFPFSPFAHDTAALNFGLTPGTLYTLRWANKPVLASKKKPTNVCPGDQVQRIIDLAEANGSSERGFIESNSASVIRQAVIGSIQSLYRAAGDIVDFTPGTKSTILDAISTRINQDSDTASGTYSQYTGNGRRLVIVPINDGGTPAGSNHRIVGFGAFFLVQTGFTGHGSGETWCAEYVGSAMKGSRKRAASTSGLFEARLVR